MLSIKNLVFNFGGTPVLKEICLSLDKGQVLSIVGPNGSGKTTLIKCILRFHRPAGGSVWIENRNAAAMKRRELARHMGYLPQNIPSMLPMSVFDTVLMGRSPYLAWTPRNYDMERVAQVLEEMELSHLAFRDIDRISGGQAQKVLLARALVQDTNYLLLDEPTSSLDLRHQLEILEIITRLAETRKIGVLLAMHDLNLAARFSHRIIMLRNGEIFCSGKPREVMTPENISQVFGVDAEVQLDNGCLRIHPLNCSINPRRPEMALRRQEKKAST